FLKLGALTFEAPERERFPGLFLAWDALHGPHGSTAVLNAANEQAVAAFLDGRVGFDAIHRVNAGTLEPVVRGLELDAPIEALMALDREARDAADVLVRGLQR